LVGQAMARRRPSAAAWMNAATELSATPVPAACPTLVSPDVAASGRPYHDASGKGGRAAGARPFSPR